MRLKGLFVCLFGCLFFAQILASDHSIHWTEYPGDPIYNPVPVIDEDYFPCVLYDVNKFNGDGDAVYYKMWAQGVGGIELSYSNDGISWTAQGLAISNAYHACVVYDKGGFGGSIYKYKMWYWTGSASYSDVSVIQYIYSTDGVTWTATQPITQNPSAPIAIGISGLYFYHLYGPGFVQYNPKATSQPGLPYTYPYIMFFDTSTEGGGPGSSENVEQIGLAYSSDGVFWTNASTEPVFIPPGNTTQWDGAYAYRPSLVKAGSTYHLFYSGSNDQSPGLTYAHGLGHATSTDGIHWTRDPKNPIFIYSDGVPWRDTRAYTPFVLFEEFTDDITTKTWMFKMWFTGGSGDVAGQNQGVGYATAPNPFVPTPPRFFRAKEKRMSHRRYNHKYFVLRAHWKNSLDSDVASYVVFKNNRLIKTLSPGQVLRFTRHLHSRRAWNKFTIAAVSEEGFMSTLVSLRKVCQE